MTHQSEKDIELARRTVASIEAGEQPELPEQDPESLWSVAS
jgi:hypothetical protein